MKVRFTLNRSLTFLALLKLNIAIVVSFDLSNYGLSGVLILSATIESVLTIHYVQFLLDNSQFVLLPTVFVTLLFQLSFFGFEEKGLIIYSILNLRYSRSSASRISDILNLLPYFYTISLNVRNQLPHKYSVVLEFLSFRFDFREFHLNVGLNFSH